MPAKHIITSLRTISLVAYLALFLVGCQTTTQKKDAVSSACNEVQLEDVRQYFADFGFSERVRKELFAEELPEAILSSRTPEELRVEVSFLADARARVLSDISYFPMRRPVLEVAGALLAQEHLVLQILYYRAIEAQDITATLALNLRDFHKRHPELPGGAATALLEELDAQERK